MTETRKHKVIFLTQRGLRHQQRALESAPPELDVTILRDPPRTDLLLLLGQAEFLISERTGTIDAEMIAAAPNLRLIQRLGVQTWDIDLPAARAAGVTVCSQPIQGCVMVAEHMVLQILGVLKRVRDGMKITADAADRGVIRHRTDEDHFAYNWSKQGGIGTLSGTAVGVLGFGEVGLELTMRLRGFNCRLLYNKRRRLPSHIEERYGLRFAAPEELAEQSDIVCSLLPYQGLKEPLDAAFFSRMKRGAYLVHCGSGAVVAEGALLAALRAGHLAGAALDTYTYEPLRADDPLVEFARNPASNLILTPHMAGGGVTPGARGRVEDYDNIMALLTGETPQHQVA